VERELIIDASSSEIEIALLENKTLVELQKGNANNEFVVGDIYLGKVKKIMGGLNAAFVDIGYEKDAFLHYLDLGPQFKTVEKYTRRAISNNPNDLSVSKMRAEKDIEKSGKITQALSSNQPIIVQIVKEAISTKGPRITSEISLAGRYLVLVPFSNRISISQKIKNIDERKRLKRLISSIKPENYGVIIRTVAETKMVADLDGDLRSLVSKWEKTTKRLRNVTPPMKVCSELDRTSAILRDLLNESFNSVHVNNANMAEEMKSYIHTIFPDKSGIVNLHKGRKQIFEQFGIDKQIKTSFGRTVTIKSGIYLVIEHTEAMHVIDINSGNRVKKDKGQEDNALEVNIESATEVARQLRLRDMGGIIVVDFIDMVDPAHRKQLFEHLKEQMSLDKAKHTVLPPSKFGLIQITRQRFRPATNVEVLEKCPTCDGTGTIRSNILFTDEIFRQLTYLLHEQNESKLKLHINPIIHAYLTKGFPSMRMKWFFDFGRWIKLVKEPSYQLIEYRFFNKQNQEIKI